MEFENQGFDQSKLLKIWEQSKIEVEMLSEKDDIDTREGNQQHLVAKVEVEGQSLENKFNI